MSAALPTVAPTCPVHQKPLRLGARGPWFCPVPVGTKADGSTLFCDQKSPRVAAAPPLPTPAASPPAAPTSSSSLAAAALTFAGKLYEGQGPIAVDEAIQCAIKAYSAMRAVES